MMLHHTQRYDAARFEVRKSDGAAAIHAEGLSATWEAGQPDLPYDVVTLLVPRGMRVRSVSALLPAGERELAAGITLAAAQPRLDTDGRPHAPPAPRAAAAVSSPHADGMASMPATRAEAAGRGALHGYQFVSVRVHPVRFVPGSGRVMLAERIDLRLDLVPVDELPVERERFSAGLEADAHRLITNQVANPEALAGYERRIGVRVDDPGRFAPTDAPSLEGSDVDAVIVTSAALAPSWQVLADWKTRRGVPTVVRTIEWIEANYRHGSDLQETIRTFVRDAYAKWAVRYVLLGGDTEVIPARYGFSNFGDDKFIPADLYFGCLDGNWNRDGDDVWGEAAISMSDPGDDTDLYAEVYTGRLPATTPADVAALVAKVMAYENPTQTTYQNEALFLAETLFPDGADLAEQLIALTSPCVVPTRLYQNWEDFPGAQPLTKAAAIAAMNAGPGIVAHIGHGYRYTASLVDGSLINSDALALTNTTKRFVLSMLNCTATAFDFPCLAEAFLESAGGAVAVMGSSRSAFVLPSQDYSRGFFTSLYQDGIVNLGAAFAESRLDFSDDAWFDTAHHYTHYLYNLLGDPEMVLHTCELGTTTASFPATAGLGLSNVAVQVNVGGVPRAGACVCLQKSTEAYTFGVTNAAGNVTLPIRIESAGLVQVTISGTNMTTFLGNITVLSGGAAYVSAQSLTVDDNASGSSDGNADGVLDAGETLELAVTFKNTGTTTASNVTGTLRIPSPWATVIDSTYTVGTLGAGASTVVTNAVHFVVQPGTPDGTVLPVTFVSRSGMTTWTDAILKIVHAPQLELALLDVNDFAPGGNADGFIQAGETFDLLAYFKNYGTGAADGVQATLATTDPVVVLFTSAVTVGRAAPLVEVTAPTRFRLRENALAENRLTLTATDDQARVRAWTITLRGPAQPLTPALDATTGPTIILVSCTPSTDADLLGYHIYRATNAVGPWTRATVDRTTRVAYLRDTGLAPSTRYYYSITAVDSSGNESPRSLVSTASTNPPQLAGWPVSLLSSGSSAPAVGDLTGDGNAEIAVGNEYLYAWTAGGIELRDDDLDPVTWGVFGSEVRVVAASIALGEMNDIRPGLEVVACAWTDTNRAFVYAGDGGILPGWPRNPDPNSAQKGYWANCAAIDVDGDGLAEVFAPAKNGNFYAWRADGAPLGAQAALKTGIGTYARSAPAFENVDSDPALEILYGAPNGTLYVLNPDGSNVAPFPITLGTEILANTAAGDVNRDGTMDVIVMTEGGALHVLNTKTGSALPGWPRGILSTSNPKSPSPALADFEFDGFLVIVLATNNGVISEIRVYDHTGATRAGWPKSVGSATSESSPVVADFSGDGIPDIVFGNEGGKIFGWDRNGVELDGFPLAVGDFVRATPYAADADGDGGIDLVLMGWDKNLYVWDFLAPYVAAAAQWPTLAHDASRSGTWKFRASPTDAQVPPSVVAAPPRRAYLAQNVPNPFNPVTTIEYGVASPGRVHLDLYDSGGRFVRALVDGEHPAGVHRALWDGRDTHGRRAPSGVYFSRLRVAGTVFTRKLVLLE